MLAFVVRSKIGGGYQPNLAEIQTIVRCLTFVSYWQSTTFSHLFGFDLRFSTNHLMNVNTSGFYIVIADGEETVYRRVTCRSTR